EQARDLRFCALNGGSDRDQMLAVWRQHHRAYVSGGTGSVPSLNRFWDDTEVVPPNMESDGRKHPVHLPTRDWFNTFTIIFVTVCTKARKPILATDSAHQ